MTQKNDSYNLHFHQCQMINVDMTKFMKRAWCLFMSNFKLVNTFFKKCGQSHILLAS